MSGPFKLDVSGEGIAQLTFDLPNEKVNKFNFYSLLEFENAIDLAATNPQIKALILRSDKDGIFIAGADLNTFKEAEHNVDLIVDLIHVGHRIFNKLQNLPFPTIALINGICLGGGTECALACTYRIATDNPKTSIGLPETTLGIVPGWGGTQRLPRLVGLEEALKLILTGKAVNGLKAYKIGLVDAYVPTNFAEERAVQFAREILTPKGKQKVLAARKKGGWRRWFLEKTPVGRELLFSQSRKSVLEKTKGKYPAPLVALDVIKQTYGLPLKEGLEIEQDRFIKSLGKEFSVATNLINLFFTQEALKKQPEGLNGHVRPISTAGVIGAGTMGGGIAWLFSSRDVDIRMKDINWDAVGLGYSHAKGIYNQMVKKRILKPYEADQKFHKIGGTVDYRGFKGSDLIVEAAVENLDVKRQIFAELEEIVSPTTIIGSNTSSLTIADMSRDMKHPERFLGMHFFNPVNRMPLVEIVPGKKTSPEAVAVAVETCKRLKKTPIVVGDCAGFLVNRVFMPGANEIMLMLGEGVPMEQIEKALDDYGMPMSPFRLVDDIGVDVTYKVSKQLEKAYGSRMTVAPILEKVYEKKLYGTKTGKGFFIHKGKEVTVNPEIQKLIGSKKSTISDEEIVQRVTLMMVNEAARCLDEGIVQNPAYLDMAMIMGTGFPPYRGGLLRDVENVGIARTIATMRQFTQKYGPRFKPCDYLEKLDYEGRRFYT